MEEENQEMNEILNMEQETPLSRLTFFILFIHWISAGFYNEGLKITSNKKKLFFNNF